MQIVIIIVGIILCLWGIGNTNILLRRLKIQETMFDTMFDTLEQNLTDEQFFHVVEEYKKALIKRLNAKVEIGKVEDDD